MLDDIFFTVVFFESLASQGSEKISSRNALLVAHLICSTPNSDSLPVAPWEALAVDTGNGYHLLHDVDGG
jgi:hypothetical protein